MANYKSKGNTLPVKLILSSWIVHSLYIL
jgi:hypothetical protein